MNNSVNMRELALEALLEIGREGRQCHTVIRQVLEKYQYLPGRTGRFSKDSARARWNGESHWII